MAHNPQKQYVNKGAAPVLFFAGVFAVASAIAYLVFQSPETGLPPFQNEGGSTIGNDGAGTATPEGKEEGAGTTTKVDLMPGGEAFVEDIEIALLESFPIQAVATVRGSVSDSCTELTGARVDRDEATFTITLDTGRPGDAICAQVLTPFEVRVPLDIAEVSPGTYTVAADTVRTMFILDADNGESDTRTSVPTSSPTEPPPRDELEGSMR